ncbi:hypothetical protein LCGC14_2221630 [marine sediment metagenome]|uniref:Uncharacterized protein n=1 Tax=marine sediment metagenome TaxID=412755 RepID=A0A0F9G6B4_9ZZZZ
MKNCGICESLEVCFMQKQIEGLAERMTLPPFYKKVDVSAERSITSAHRHESRMGKRWNLECELRGVIAKNCPLF